MTQLTDKQKETLLQTLEDSFYGLELLAAGIGLDKREHIRRVLELDGVFPKESLAELAIVFGRDLLRIHNVLLHSGLMDKDQTLAYLKVTNISEQLTQITKLTAEQILESIFFSAHQPNLYEEKGDEQSSD